MKNKLIYTLLLGLFLLFTGCESNPNESKSISKMNIGDATTLFIASSANGMAKISPKGNNDAVVATKRLFKITEDGVVEDVVYTDEDGNEITESFTPSNMYFIENSPYFFADFGYEGMFLVNKETGDVYKTSMDNQGGYLIDNMQLEKFGFFENSPFATTDDKGNIYYRWYEDTSVRVHKIDISNINLFTDKALTPVNEDVYEFVVSEEGDLVYQFINWSLPDYPSGRRFRSLDGRLSSVFEDSYDGVVFRGLDGELFVFDLIWDSEESDYFSLVQKTCFSDNGILSFDTISYQKIGESEWSSSKYLIVLPYKVLMIYLNSSAVVLDSRNKSEVGMSFDINDNMRITDLHYTDSYIYCCGEIEGNFSLVRIDPYTYSKDVIMQNNDYEIYSFTVLDDESIMFNGLRLSDGKNIIASIEKNGKFKILDETLNSQESVLERIQYYCL